MGRVLVCVVLAAGVLAAQASSPQGPVFRSGAENVPIFVTVSDKSGQLVPDLTRADFQIFDNGKPQALTVFDNSPQPIRLIIMVDVSGSMAGNVNLLRAAAAQLLNRLGPGDLVRIGTFGATIEISPSFTRDIGELGRALPTFIPAGAPTPLWQAVDKAIGEFGQGGTARPVVLVMSDGKDSGPMPGGWRSMRWLTPIEIIDRAEQEDVMIYGIAVHSRGQMGGNMRDQLVGHLPDPSLGKVAEDTGGGYHELRPRDDLGATFARIADELHHQYLLGFVPPARDGKMHKIEIKLTKKDMKARARKAYRAPKSPS
jgi:Ca-activated chloride channel family protein